MVEDWVREVLKKQEPIHESLRYLLGEEGIITGSYIFGGYDELDSDVDVVISPETMWEDRRLSFDAFSPYFAYTTQEYDEEAYRTLYVKNEDGVIINVILPWNMEEYYLWEKATKLMGKMCSLGSVRKIVSKNKSKRLRLFESLKELFEE